MRTTTPLEPITSAALEKFLLAQGFVRAEAPGKAVLFRHEPTEALIILPEMEPSETVEPLDVLTVRRTFIEKGILSAAEYSRSLRTQTHPARRNSRLMPTKSGPI